MYSLDALHGILAFILVKLVLAEGFQLEMVVKDNQVCIQEVQ